MTTLDQILNPVPAVLAAWGAILKEAGHKVYGPRDETPETTASGEEEIAKQTPYIETRLEGLRASSQQHPVGDDIVWSAWTAALYAKVATMRGKNGQKHDVICGSVYVASARYRSLFNPATLPFHGIMQMKPSSLLPTTEGLLDFTDIGFDIDIVVRDNAWPDLQ